MRAAPVLFWLGISIWVGGIAVLALVVAPVTFKSAPSREIAGAIFGNALRVFSFVEFGCAALAATGTALLLTKSRLPGDLVRAVMLGTMILILVVVQAWLAPAMRDLQGRMGPDGELRDRFTTLHKISEKAYGANLLIGLSLIVLTAIARKE